MTDQDIAIAVCFVLTIDGHPLGAFTSCEGLGCEMVMEQREEGGNNGFVHQLPTRVKYSNVKLSRPITEASKEFPTWFAKVDRGVVARTATIEAKTPDGRLITSWGLRHVLPVRWTGPQFAADSAKVATETIELSHQGFFGPGWGG
jgi:phage tail-like protein